MFSFSLMDKDDLEMVVIVHGMFPPGGGEMGDLQVLVLDITLHQGAVFRQRYDRPGLDRARRPGYREEVFPPTPTSDTERMCAVAPVTSRTSKGSTVVYAPDGMFPGPSVLKRILSNQAPPV